MAGSDEGDDDREWEISLEDLESDDDAGASDGDAGGDGDGDGDGDGETTDEGATDEEGLLAKTRPIEPGSPSLENVAFFVLGIVAAAAVIYALVP